MPNNTQVKLSLRPDQVRAYAMDEQTQLSTLESLGINATPRAMREFMAMAQDAAPDLITSASTSTPVQFLQHFLPDVIRTITQARTADNIIGRDIAGNWADEEVVATVLEHTGQAKPYGDKTNPVLADWNPNFERRTIVRFEEAVEVHALEEARASSMRVNSASEKRMSVGTSFAVELNKVAFYGYNDGANRTYGILNDPNLPAYTTVATGTGGFTWAEKTFLEIVNDIKTAMSALRRRSGSNFDPYKDECCLSIADVSIDMLATVNELGTTSVREWIAQTYPKCRIENAPQYTGANGGSNVFYLIAETIGGRKVANQYVQDVFRMLGVEKQAKGFLEAYSCATAGALFAQPIGVVRYTGI